MRFLVRHMHKLDPYAVMFLLARHGMLSPRKQACGLVWQSGNGYNLALLTGAGSGEILPMDVLPFDRAGHLTSAECIDIC
jgi:hypothetical protein